MTEAELDRLLELLAPEGKSFVDFACGSGELLIRCHELRAEASIGVDLSPWMLQAAAARSRQRLADAGPQWVLADAAQWLDRRSPQTEASTDSLACPDRVVCLGAEWIWHGMPGTIAALAGLAKPGGIVAFGGPRLHFDADPDTVTEQFGKLDTAQTVEARLSECGLELIERIDPGEAGWLAYLERGRNDVLAWHDRHGDERSQQWVTEQQGWSDLFERDRHVVGWSVWVSHKA